MLIDTHLHLDLMDNMQSFIDEFRVSDVGALAVGTTPKAFSREQQYYSSAINIKVGLGLHPQLVLERERDIDLFLELVKDTRFVGEVGLDFRPAYISSREQQLRIFREIAIACAKEEQKVISIHSIKASQFVIEELKGAGTFQNCICIFHWFTGTKGECQKAIEAGAWFSINPRMVRTKSGQETVKTIPSNRLLLETDAPFSMKIENMEQLHHELEKLVTLVSEIRGENIKPQIETNSAVVFGGNTF